MKRSAPLQRYTPIRQRRATLSEKSQNGGQAQGRGTRALAGGLLAERDGKRCQDCGIVTHYRARYDGDPNAYDMAHIQSRGAQGSDTLGQRNYKMPLLPHERACGAQTGGDDDDSD
jgi:hypothetical protein